MTIDPLAFAMIAFVAPARGGGGAGQGRRRLEDRFWSRFIVLLGCMLLGATGCLLWLSDQYGFDLKMDIVGYMIMGASLSVLVAGMRASWPPPTRED